MNKNYATTWQYGGIEVSCPLHLQYFTQQPHASTVDLDELRRLTVSFVKGTRFWEKRSKSENYQLMIERG